MTNPDHPRPAAPAGRPYERVRVGYIANGGTRNARFTAPEDRHLTVQVDGELSRVTIRDDDGRLRGEAWYCRTIRVLLDEAGELEVPG